MFNRIATPVCLTLFCLAASLTSAASAQAARYGSFVLHNPSDTAINYAISWGDGEFKVFTVGAHEQNAHYIELDENGEIPSPVITFDCKGDDAGTVTLVSYDIDAYIVTEPHEGKDYTFEYTSDGRFIDLFAS
jgi:hypothetical protein